MIQYTTGAFTDLLVIINEPGRYLTRKGQIAHVDKIRTTNSTKGVPAPTFAAIGHIEHSTARGHRSEFTTWHVSGRNTAIGLSANDIMSKDDQ